MGQTLVDEKNVVEGSVRMCSGTHEAWGMRGHGQQEPAEMEKSCLEFRGTWQTEFRGRSEVRQTLHRTIMVTEGPK